MTTYNALALDQFIRETAVTDFTIDMVEFPEDPAVLQKYLDHLKAQAEDGRHRLSRADWAELVELMKTRSEYYKQAQRDSAREDVQLQWVIDFLKFTGFRCLNDACDAEGQFNPNAILLPIVEDETQPDERRRQAVALLHRSKARSVESEIDRMCGENHERTQTTTT